MNITPEIIKREVADHDNRWDAVSSEMRELRDVYETRYWRGRSRLSGALVIELSLGYEFIESYIASLYAREPAVIVSPDVRVRGDAEIAGLAANYWMAKVRQTVEDATRLALIFPYAAVKLYPTDNRDVLRRVGISTIEPWDVVLDRDADSWETQRFIGHRYWVPLSDAKKTWGNKKYDARAKRQYLTTEADSDAKSTVDDYGRYVQVVEVYDMVGDRLYIWSPDYKNGDEWLYHGIKLVGYDENGDEITTVYKSIPIRTADDEPRLPISPVYMNTLPYDPLAGYSALRRVYDQIRERIFARTYQAAAVRKAARQWLVRKDSITGDNMEALVEGIDGEFIEVEGNSKLDEVIFPVPHTPTPPEIERYSQEVQSDLDRGSIMAPFTRGEATKATASEVTALAAYTASEVGRMARVRDAVIESVAAIYVDMLRIYLADEPQLVTINGSTVTLKSGDLDAAFVYYAQDGGSTPVDRTVRRQELQNAVPMLQALGVPKETILSELIRVNDWPESFLPSAPTPGAVLPEGAPAPGQVEGALPAPATGLEPGLLPSPERIAQLVP